MALETLNVNCAHNSRLFYMEKKFCCSKFNDVKDAFTWKIIPNHEQYVINQYGDIFNRLSGLNIRMAVNVKSSNFVPLINNIGKLSNISVKKQVRDLFDIGYLKQDEIRNEKLSTFYLAQYLKSNV